MKKRCVFLVGKKIILRGFALVKKASGPRRITPILIFIVILIFAPHLAFAKIVINEIGAFESSDSEWIEIYNTGAEAMDMTDWKFFENNVNHSITGFQGDMTVQPGEYAIIANKADVFVIEKGFSGTVLDSAWSSLREDGEELALKDVGGNFVERFTYVPAPDFSLERIDPTLDDYSANNWQEHESGHTAGGQNSSFAAGPKPEPEPPKDPNQPPLAVINALSESYAGHIITFNASHSLDPEGKPLTFLWDVGDGTLSSAEKIYHAYALAGTYEVNLKVSDGELVNTDASRITIKPIDMFQSVPPVQRDNRSLIYGLMKKLLRKYTYVNLLRYPESRAGLGPEEDFCIGW